MSEKFLDRGEAAAFIASHGLKISKGTLGKFATVGGGPRYRIFGIRAVYSEADLESWIAAKLSAPRFSTSQAT